MLLFDKRAPIFHKVKFINLFLIFKIFTFMFKESFLSEGEKIKYDLGLICGIRKEGFGMNLHF